MVWYGLSGWERGGTSMGQVRGGRIGIVRDRLVETACAGEAR